MQKIEKGALALRIICAGSAAIVHYCQKFVELTRLCPMTLKKNAEKLNERMLKIDMNVLKFRKNGVSAGPVRSQIFKNSEKYEF